MSDHSITNACHSSPTTRTPKSCLAPYLLQSNSHHPRTGTNLNSCESLRIREATLATASPQASVERSADYTFLFKTLLESNSLLRKEIRNLQRDHQSTLRLIYDKSDVDAKRRELTVDQTERNRHVRCGSDQKEATHNLPPRMVLDQAEDGVEEDAEHEGDSDISIEDISPGELHSSTEDSELSDRESSSVKSVKSFQSNVEISSACSSLLLPNQREEEGISGFASPGAIAVGRMWDNFSVDDYDVPYNREHNGDDGRNSKWKPNITIPQPFSMTIREATTPRKKSRTMVRAERESIEREAAEEAELRKQFRALPLPASTFLPLYELINAKNEQRKRLVRKLSGRTLQASQKPFTFSKRDEKRRKQKYEYLAQNQELEDKERLRESHFKAKPLPEKLFDPEVDELLLEQEEYRKIRRKMRAKALLERSKIPGSTQMRESWHKYNTRSVHRQEKLLENANQYSYQPKISHRIPDYDEAFYRFQQELVVKKNAKVTTSTEPFHLHTEEVASKRAKAIKDRVVKESSKSTMSSKSCRPLRPSPAVYPAQMTETARVRQSLTQEKLAGIFQKEIMEEDERRAKRERERDLQKLVSQKSLDQDPTAWIEERREEKMQEFRQKDRERHLKYQQQLSNIKKRLEARPLLLEQGSQALKKAGPSDNETQILEGL